MPAYRQIHTKIWKDGWFLDLDTTDKLLFIYLFSNERSNLAGIYDVPLKVIAFETDIPLKEIQISLERFARRGKAFYEDGWIWIPNLLRYNAQNITSPKIQTHLRSCLAEVPDMPLKARWIEVYNRIVDEQYRMDTVSSPMDTVPYQEQEPDPEQDPDPDQGEKPAATAAPPVEEKPLPKTEKPPPKTKGPPPPAVQAYRSATNLYPLKSLWPGIAKTIGDEPGDLDRWKRTCLAYVACGWNPKNVKGMMEYFVRDELPSTKGGDSGTRRGRRGEDDRISIQGYTPQAATAEEFYGDG